MNQKGDGRCREDDSGGRLMKTPVRRGTSRLLVNMTFEHKATVQVSKKQEDIRGSRQRDAGDRRTSDQPALLGESNRTKLGA